MNSLEDLKDRIKWMDKYHLEERAARLQEIGGPGVGGLEPRYSPHLITQADTEKGKGLMALQDSISKLWNEAAMCYVNGQFRACIVLFATLLEAALKYELERGNIDFPERFTLRQCIDKCKKHHILPRDEKGDVTAAAIKVNNERNDVVHANIERHRPESLLGEKGPEHQVESVRDPYRYIKDGALTGDGETILLGEEGLGIIYWYKAAAKNTLECTKEVMKFLYPSA